MKYYGVIGYGETVETSPGVWSEAISEREHYGDVISDGRQFQSSGQVNDNLLITNSFSILADPYALQNFSFMRYILFMGVKWRITKIEIQYPRIIISTGGVYNG